MPESRERGRNFIFGGEPLRQDRLSGGLEGWPREGLFLTRYTQRLDQGRPRVGNACSQEAGIQLAANRVIGARRWSTWL